MKKRLYDDLVSKIALVKGRMSRVPDASLTERDPCLSLHPVLDWLAGLSSYDNKDKCDDSLSPRQKLPAGRHIWLPIPLSPLAVPCCGRLKNREIDDGLRAHTRADAYKLINRRCADGLVDQD